VTDSGCSSLSTVRQNTTLVDTTNNEINVPVSKCQSKRPAQHDESARPTKVVKYQ
jgi:hypothetical protein